MTGVAWQRWVLGAAVAGVLPLAIGGAGCSGKDETPEAAGASSTSGSATGGSGTAGSDTAGSGTAGSGTAGSGTAEGGTGAGGSSGAGQGGAIAQCCSLGDKPSCSGDGRTLKSCYSVPGGSCASAAAPAPGIYAYVWTTQECLNGCESGVGGGGGSSIAQCK